MRRKQVSDENKEEVREEAIPTKAISLNENNILAPKDHKELATVINFLAKGGAFPEVFKTNEQRLAGYNLAKSLMGNSWALAINHIAPIKGKLCIWGEFPRTLAERTGQVEQCHIYLIDEQYKRICLENKNLDAKPYAGICDIKRKDRKENQFTYTIKQAELADQYPPMKNNWVDGKNLGKIPNTDSPWFKFMGIMLMRKAQAAALKFEFPECFVGVEIAEYEYDVAPDLVPIKDVTELSETEKFNQRYGDDVSKEETSSQQTSNGSSETETVPDMQTTQ